MKKIQYILFDCMETLIDFTELPREKEYAMWSYSGSGIENCWPDFEEFLQSFLEMRQYFQNRTPKHKEYSILERYEMMVSKHDLAKNLSLTQEERMTIVKKLCKNFWDNYTKRCFVSPEVEALLKSLRNKTGLGVVSNFIVPGGLEELLISKQIRGYFNFVLSSAELGWRKPHRLIYEKALAEAGTSVREMIFIGDDLNNDYHAPREMGIRSLLYDRKNKHPEIRERFSSFEQIEKILEMK
ncbi:HAD-superfamily hydrolase, subfamily IA, variant 1 [Syntrophobotulus glycolicus DSM 8271]|uniref:HAD-superfamily hydrolase, subfamily IA, variant 1 n=1 Tax=Syntrophobotulus glycolicus (strain DSM 8271 / FlGlyR) TaxID=645991 RepID=F0SVN6_SYNGF|nr:HAD family hydrolase [Syntrophobotulus glycolicus]ADY54512.1 HAD-superfamily hydrolase, subfamily IA, variant 1 [Syntrophobotulus glycolicus DSM 8271]